MTSVSLMERTIIASKFHITEVVCGMAKGADSLGEDWAKRNKIPIKYFPADWDKYGRSAGPIRNGEMAKYGDALILLWDGKSSGSAGMKKLAEKEQRIRNFPIYEYQERDDETT